MRRLPYNLSAIDSSDPKLAIETIKIILADFLSVNERIVVRDKELRIEQVQQTEAIEEIMTIAYPVVYDSGIVELTSGDAVETMSLAEGHRYDYFEAGVEFFDGPDLTDLTIADPTGGTVLMEVLASALPNTWQLPPDTAVWANGVMTFPLSGTPPDVNAMVLWRGSTNQVRVTADSIADAIAFRVRVIGHKD